ncbi:MAG: P-II family nitrogen regulator [Oscillospiraceae bacterium]|nr:P-II family nitrogen regulator [Oscillospiraceae bacterium]
MTEYTLIFCVVKMGDADKIFKYAKKYDIKGGTVSIGRGTVNSRLLNFLALNEIRKEVVTIIVKSSCAAEVIKDIGEHMEFEKPNHGIAFSYPISEHYGSIRLLDSVENINSNNAVRSETMYNIIYAIVEKGKAEDVVEAANKVGSSGGTIINARAAGCGEVRRFFSIEIEPEKEEVFIIAKNELKDKIVESIRESLEIDKGGNGLLFVLEADEVYGLH